MGMRVVRVNLSLLTELFTEGWTLPSDHAYSVRCDKGLPPGATLLRVLSERYADSDEIGLVFTHPSWEKVPGHSLPEIKVEFSKVTVPTA